MPCVGNGLVGGLCGAGTGASHEEPGAPPRSEEEAAAAELAWLAAVACAGGHGEGGGGGGPFNIAFTAIAWTKKGQGPSFASRFDTKSRERLHHHATTSAGDASWRKPIAQ